MPSATDPLRSARPSVSRSAAARSGTTSAAPPSPNSTSSAPSPYRSATAAATCRASRVLPTPPGPHSVTTRHRCTASTTRATSAPRPTNELSGTRSRGGRAPVACRGAGPTGSSWRSTCRSSSRSCGRRVEPELVGQPGAQAGERRERVALAPGGDQRLHEHADDLLPQRLRGHQRLELRDGLRGPTHGQQRRGVLLAAPARSAASRAISGASSGWSSSGYGLAPPQRQRRVQTGAARGRVVEGRCRGEVVGEGRDVDVRPVGVQPVALGGRGQPEGGGQHAAQPGDVGLHRAGRVDRQVVRPDEVGQAQDVDGAPEVRRERGEQPPLTGGAEPDRAGAPSSSSGPSTPSATTPASSQFGQPLDT